MDAEKTALAADVEFGVEMDKKDKQVQPMPLKTVLSVNTLLMYTFYQGWGASVGAGAAWKKSQELEPEPLIN